MKERKVSDIGLAAYLTALDYPLVRIVGPEGRREFVFTGVPDEVIFRFYGGGQDLVSARKLLSAFRDLKGLLLQVF